MYHRLTQRANVERLSRGRPVTRQHIGDKAAHLRHQGRQAAHARHGAERRAPGDRGTEDAWRGDTQQDPHHPRNLLQSAAGQHVAAAGEDGLEGAERGGGCREGRAARVCPVVAGICGLEVAEEALELGADVGDEGLCNAHGAAAAYCVEDGDGAVEEGGFDVRGRDGCRCSVAQPEAAGDDGHDITVHEGEHGTPVKDDYGIQKLISDIMEERNIPNKFKSWNSR